MKKLFLVRHSNTEKYSETNRDIDRKLTSEGMKIASLLGKYLKDEGVIPDAIISSSAQRAQLTAELAATQLGFDIDNLQIVESLYEASIRGFVEFLKNLYQSYNTVLVVGHNPTITYVADFLSNVEISGMSPGAVVQINFELDSWGLLDKGLGQFINYYDLPGETN